METLTPYIVILDKNGPEATKEKLHKEKDLTALKAAIEQERTLQRSAEKQSGKLETIERLGQLLEEVEREQKDPFREKPQAEKELPAPKTSEGGTTVRPTFAEFRKAMDPDSKQGALKMAVMFALYYVSNFVKAQSSNKEGFLGRLFRKWGLDKKAEVYTTIVESNVRSPRTINETPTSTSIPRPSPPVQNTPQTENVPPLPTEVKDAILELPKTVSFEQLSRGNVDFGKYKVRVEGGKEVVVNERHWKLSKKVTVGSGLLSATIPVPIKIKSTSWANNELSIAATLDANEKIMNTLKEAGQQTEDSAIINNPDTMGLMEHLATQTVPYEIIDPQGKVVAILELR